jgi:hypothetical protein
MVFAEFYAVQKFSMPRGLSPEKADGGYFEQCPSS